MFGQEVLIISVLSKFDNGVQDLKHERMILSHFFFAIFFLTTGLLQVSPL